MIQTLRAHCSKPAAPTRRDVMQSIQAKAETGIYEIRGFGTLRPRTWATFDDLTFMPGALTRIPLEGYRESVLDPHRPGHAVRGETDRARNPADGHRHELRRALAQRQDRAGHAARGMAGTSTTTGDGGMLDVERAESRVLDLRGAAQPLRDQHPAPAPGRRDRADDRPGGQARDRRIAAGLEGLRGDRPAPRPAAGRRSALLRAGIPISSAPTTWSSRSKSCARRPTGRCRSSSRWAPRVSSTTSGWPPRPAPT